MGYSKELARKAIESLADAQVTMSVADHIWLYEQLVGRINYAKKELDCGPHRFTFNGKTYGVYITFDAEWNLVYLAGKFGTYTAIELSDFCDPRQYTTIVPFEKNMDEDDIEQMMWSAVLDETQEDLDGMLDALKATIF